MARPRDTTTEAHSAQLAIWRRLGPEERSRLAVRMSEGAREVTRAGIRKRHPNYSAEQVRLIMGKKSSEIAWRISSKCVM